MAAQKCLNSGSETGAKNHTAAYIEDLVREMEQLAARHGMEPLRDLLRLAKEEARQIALSDRG